MNRFREVSFRFSPALAVLGRFVGSQTGSLHCLFSGYSRSDTTKSVCRFIGQYGLGLRTMCSLKGEFSVNVSKVEVVTPQLPMQEHTLPLSNLDLLIPPMDVGAFFCYKKPFSMSFGSIVGSLKNALAQALVSYYPLAGELVTNSMGEPEVFCSNRGVDFVEAVADVELQSLNLCNPDDTIEGKLVPTKKHGLLAVQVTQLKCGGLIVACTFDHYIADAYSINMFLVSWAEIAQSNKSIMLTQPCFQRSLLIPRHPLSIHPSLHDMYIPITALSSSDPKLGFESEPLITRIYYITSENLNLMQELASSNGVKRTKFESFSAFLWKMVAEATSSVNDKKNFVAKMGVVVDGRKRLNNGDKNMDTYFGNVLSLAYGGKHVEELVEKPLSWVAENVHEFLEMAITEEHFLGLVDWVEEHRPVPVLPRLYSGEHESEKGPSFVVSSGQRFPESKVDFGWGKPVFASYHVSWDSGDVGFVVPMPCSTRNGDWLVYMHLLKGHLNFLESRTPQIFMPFSWEYLFNHY